MNLDRVPPQNIDAERAVLGAMLMIDEHKMRAITTCLQELKGEDTFYREAHRKVFQAIADLFASDKDIDLLTVTAELERNGHLEKVGGVPYLNDLIESCPSAANAKHYAEMVKEEAVRRQLIYRTAEVNNLVYDETEDVDELLTKCIEDLLKIKLGQLKERKSVKQAIKDVFVELQDISRSPTKLLGIPTGINDIDEKLSGLRGGDLVIIAARPGVGKCLSGDAMMIDAATGGRVTAREFYERKISNTLSLNVDAETIEKSAVANHIWSGVQNIYAVTTQQGATVEVTEDHPMLTPLGWRKFKYLVPGESYIAVSSAIPDYGQGDDMTDREALLLGYLLAEGTLSDTTILVTTKSDDVLSDLRDCVAEKDCVLRNTPGRITYRIVRADGSRKPNTNPITRWIRDLGLYGTKSGTKFIPDLVFRQTNRKISLVLSGLFSGDGWHSQHIGIVSKSKQMMLDVKHLLLRFGILCRLKTDYNKRYDSYYYRLMITDYTSKRRFCDRIGFRRPVPNPKMPKYKDWGVSYNCIVGDVRFELVRGIKYIGAKDTYDFSIDSHHNFIANDIVVHNSTFVQNVAQHVAGDLKKYVAMFSLEMRAEQIVSRILASESGIKYTRFRVANFKDSEWGKLTIAAGKITEFKLEIEDTPGLTPNDIRTHIGDMTADKGKPALGIIDYLQLMEPTTPTGRRVDDMTQISRQLKGMAMDLDIPLLVVSQLNRQPENRPDKRPQLSDLRESGAIEQDADIVAFLFREDYYERTASKGGPCEFIIAKQRMGSTGTVKVHFDLARARFMQAHVGGSGKATYRERLP